MEGGREGGRERGMEGFENSLSEGRTSRRQGKALQCKVKKALRIGPQACVMAA